MALIRRCLFHHVELTGPLMSCPSEQFHPSFHFHSGHFEPNSWEVYRTPDEDYPEGLVVAIVLGDFNVKWAILEPEPKDLAGRTSSGMVVNPRRGPHYPHRPAGWRPAA